MAELVFKLIEPGINLESEELCVSIACNCRRGVGQGWRELVACAGPRGAIRIRLADEAVRTLLPDWKIGGRVVKKFNC